MNPWPDSWCVIYVGRDGGKIDGDVMVGWWNCVIFETLCCSHKFRSCWITINIKLNLCIFLYIIKWSKSVTRLQAAWWSAVGTLSLVFLSVRRLPNQRMICKNTTSSLQVVISVHFSVATSTLFWDRRRVSSYLMINQLTKIQPSVPSMSKECTNFL